MLKIGTILKERYQIEKFISQGGMGNIYLANDMRLEGRLCAIKEIWIDFSLTDDVIQQTREQFLREATVLARLDHPNLPKVSDFFSEETNDYLVMDYIPGDDLRQRMLEAKGKGEFLAEKDVLSWALQLADALEYLHKQDPQILHRDIKPSNIKITPNGLVKLVDFGLVKILASNEGTITIVQGKGTVLYTPLEQYGGDTGHTDGRSDIYAFGATLYHLLTNTPPHEARERFLTTDDLNSMHDLNPAISPRTESAILWAMRLHPDDRPQSIEEFRKALVGDWNPSTRPTATLPPPTIHNILHSKLEKQMLIVAGILLFFSLIATLSHL